jgi:hypothetical protein
MVNLQITKSPNESTCLPQLVLRFVRVPLLLPFATPSCMPFLCHLGDKAAAQKVKRCTSDLVCPNQL